MAERLVVDEELRGHENVLPDFTNCQVSFARKRESSVPRIASGLLGRRHSSAMTSLLDPTSVHS